MNTANEIQNYCIREALRMTIKSTLRGGETWPCKLPGPSRLSRVLFSSLSPHWATPKAVYDELNKEFRFDFDPCPLGESTADGAAPLLTPWAGRRVFCNPPYDRGIASFLERATEAAVAVFLLPARTDTKWFHNLVIPNAREIRFIKGRLKFGNAKNSAPFPSMVCIYEKK
jgi:hypothetical protein